MVNFTLKNLRIFILLTTKSVIKHLRNTNLIEDRRIILLVGHSMSQKEKAAQTEVFPCISDQPTILRTEIFSLITKLDLDSTVEASTFMVGSFYSETMLNSPIFCYL